MPLSRRVPPSGPPSGFPPDAYLHRARRPDFTRGLIATALLIAGAASLPGRAIAASNEEARIALDVRAPSPSRSCDGLAGAFPACSSIQTSLLPVGGFSAAIVLYDFTAIRGASYTVSWPADWDVTEFVSCSDLTIGGDVSQNPMDVSGAWTTTRVSAGGTSGITLGILRGTATSPGAIRILGPEAGHTLQVVDAGFAIDDIREHFDGAVGETAPGEPCAFDAALAARFDAVSHTGIVPLDVAFIDHSTGSPTSWSWDFGDGGASSLQNPQHTYASCGQYDVRLTVGNGTASDDTSRAGFVNATDSLVAGFSVQATYQGCVPLLASFSDRSSGHPTSWLWEFGDGETSTIQNPSHVYVTAGLYDVRLTVQNGCGSSTYLLARAVDARGKASPDFTAEGATGCAPLEVQFFDASHGLPLTWLWDFGDGQTSTDQAPLHTYTNPGTYSVSLTVHNACGDSTIAKPDFVHAQPPPAADFTATPIAGCPPLAVQFTGLSTGGGTATGWSWDFGDGATSSEASPSHNYADPGDFAVTLTVTTTCGPATRTRTGYIHVLPLPIADFAATPTHGCSPLPVQFMAVTDSTVTAWQWSFGDGTTSTEQNPLHTYATPGTYTVSLVATASCTSAPMVREQYIHVLGEPAVVRFTSIPRQGCAPIDVRFTDQTGAGDVDLLWDFGDSTTSTERGPTHTFTGRRAYDITLHASGECGTGSAIQRNFIIANRAPIPTFTVSSKVACPGVPVFFGNLTGGEVTTWSWDFGDGYTSELREPSHVYDTPGTYDVALSATTPCGDSHSVVHGLIAVLDWSDPECDPEATEFLGPYAELEEGGIVIRWVLSPSASYAGYHVLRATAPDGPFARVNPQLIPDRSREGQRTLTWRDTGAAPEVAYYYRIEAVRTDGTSDFFSAPGPIIMPLPDGAVRVLTLGEPRPTPAGSGSRVELDLALPPGQGAHVFAAVYDSRGRRVAMLADRPFSGGEQHLVWNGNDEAGKSLGAGIYFIRVESGGRAWTRKAVLVR